MYGMVNRALQSMVEASHGPQMWERIRDRAGVLITALGQPEKHEFTFFNSYLQQISMPRFRGT